MLRRLVCLCVAPVALALLATPAFAGDAPTTARDIGAAVDSYLADDAGAADGHLVGGPGTAGYDSGFWIRGGDFMLRINATLQARFEAFDIDDEDQYAAGRADFEGQAFQGGDLSGFSLPRATLKFSGEAPCDTAYYLELEFGHFGKDVVDRTNFTTAITRNENLGPGFFAQSMNHDTLREAWVEWRACEALNFRMGQIKLPTTRQLMTAPELQQFVDISLASSWTGWFGIGYTDRNRDHGLMVHGTLGCNLDYAFAVSNGDGGDSIRNVLDHRTSDNVAFSGRVNWAFLDPVGYEEGALSASTCGWRGEIGVWGQIYDDRVDKPHQAAGDYLAYGVDLALGYGGFSFTGALSVLELTDAAVTSGDDLESVAWLAQLGYHFPGTAFEVAARASAYTVEAGSTFDGEATEFAFGLNYYLNGHGNKMQLDVSFLDADEQGFVLPDYYAGISGFGTRGENEMILLRFQWQLAL